MSEQFDSIYWRGQGKGILSARSAIGAPLGFSFQGDIESIEGAPSTTRHNVKENVTGNRLTAASFVQDQSFPITINFKSVKPEHLAQALQATLTTVAADSAPAEAHVAYDDTLVVLNHVKVSSVVVKGSGGTPTYTVTTDYIVHADEGMIETLGSGSIGDATDIEVDYDFAAQKEVAANPANVEYTLVFAGINTANNDKQGRCTVHKIIIDPGFLSMIQADTEGNMSVGAEILADTLRSAGDQLYTWIYED